MQIEPFHLSRSSDGKTEWFSARDAATGVSIPCDCKDRAIALVASLNVAFKHHVTTEHHALASRYNRLHDTCARLLWTDFGVPAIDDEQTAAALKDLAEIMLVDALIDASNVASGGDHAD